MTTIPPQDGVTFLHELSPGARALAARCVPRVNEFARRMALAPLEEVPGYGELPVDVRNVEIAAAARHELRLFVRRGNGVHAPVGVYGAFRERAARRAEENVPLHLLLRAHALGAYMLWKTLRDTARPGEEAALVELSGLLLRAQEGIAGAVAETYLAEYAALVAEQGEQRRSLVRGLLDGALPSDAGTLDALGLDRGGLVLHLRVDRTAEPAVLARTDRPRRDAGRPAGRLPRPALSPVALRRRRRRMQTVLDRAFGTDVLTLLEDDGGHAIVPARTAPDSPPQTPDGLAERLQRACGGQVRIAAVATDRPAGIADAARTASEVVRIAQASGRPPGMHRLDDVLLEFHLSRQNESSGPIAALLDPIGERPELVETLSTYLEHQQDRRVTARRLGLHPNTVDNRLARIADLTGLDLASPRGTALALAALLLRDGPARGFR
jgi:PucR C-terminal helix-turn-helix domain